ncbi:hypothetical protein BD626DRAFT_565248 [Schizophyllum amplum]|uniref:ACB domain-containing protein n=1 Tax=Schizophyllum amplum TaxID=97359 RepID=A0A550CUE9_9AGAR|nr:hypothetical protein BD626DRAFT_565248 [Auriculariopsis ampla]
MSRELIDAQFERAVEIVQGLPKTGPIQTDYEEKLTILYKQATVGNVKSPRPGIWDMLGRAKWDAWAKHKDLTPLEAKWLYVDALLKVLRKYGDKTIAMNFVKELESFGNSPSHHTMIASRSRASSSSGSTVSDKPSPIQYPHPNLMSPTRHPNLMSPTRHPQPDSSSGEEEDEEDDEYAHEEESRHSVPALSVVTQFNRDRPPSSAPSPRFYTPRPGMNAVPATQPQPTFETPSAFADAIPPSPAVYPSMYTAGPRSNPSPTPRGYQSFSAGGALRGSGPYDPVRPPSRLTLEIAVQSIQAHLAALSERLELIEQLQVPAARSPTNTLRRAYDLEDMGLWSLVVRPLSSTAERLKDFFARNDTRSPAQVILRRLCLDASFLLCVVMLIRTVWRRSGVRRREVISALIVLWRAILGRKQRAMHSRA